MTDETIIGIPESKTDLSRNNSISETTDLTESIDFSDFSDFGQIGSGGSCNVYNAFWKRKNARVAIKLFRAGIGKNSGMESLEESIFKKEYNFLLRLQHKNIIKLHGFGILKESITRDKFIVLELGIGSLDKYIGSNSELNTRKSWCLDVVNGLYYLHECVSPAIIHRDLKFENILLVGENVKNSVLKLTDFGGSTTTTHVTSTFCMSARWVAPEILCGKDHTKESDIFSLCLILLGILVDKTPFSEVTTPGIQKMLFDKLKPPEIVELVKYWDTYCYKNIIENGLDFDPLERPDLFEILKGFKEKTSSPLQASEKEKFQTENQKLKDKIKNTDSLLQEYEKLNNIYTNQISDLEAKNKTLNTNITILESKNQELSSQNNCNSLESLKLKRFTFCLKITSKDKNSIKILQAVEEIIFSTEIFGFSWLTAKNSYRKQSKDQQFFGIIGREVGAEEDKYFRKHVIDVIEQNLKDRLWKRLKKSNKFSPLVSEVDFEIKFLQSQDYEMNNQTSKNKAVSVFDKKVIDDLKVTVDFEKELPSGFMRELRLNPNGSWIDNSTNGKKNPLSKLHGLNGLISKQFADKHDSRPIAPNDLSPVELRLKKTGSTQNWKYPPVPKSGVLNKFMKGPPPPPASTK